MKQRGFANTRPRPVGEDWIYGIHAVGGWLRHRPQRIRSLRVADADKGSPAAAELIRLARAAAIPMERATPNELSELTGTRRHQGFAARCGPFPYVEIEDVVAMPASLLLVIDHLQDPHNLGAILRSCAAVGGSAVLLPKDGTVGVTPSVEAAAAGTAARLPVCRVTNVARTLELLKREGYWVVGLCADAGVDLYRGPLPDRIVLVLGGETGLRRLVREKCDLTVSIPMAEGVESLNASVAAAVALFEIQRRHRHA